MKIGVVGCGTVAEYHMPFIVKHKDVERVLATDLNADKAIRLAQRYGIEASPNFQAMLQSQRLDVVHVLTPPKTHAELAIRAIEAGCHVYVEKPMAVTVKETEAMNNAARRKRVKLCVGHSKLHAPVMLKARNLIERGEVGKLLHVDVSYHFDIASIFPSATNNDEKTEWIESLPGGLLFELMPHPVSILLQFIKEPVQLCATGTRSGTDSHRGLDEIRASFTGTDATGFLSLSLGTRPDGLTVRLYGTKMSVHVNLPNMTIVTCRKRNVRRTVSRAVENLEHAAQLLSCTLVNGFRFALGAMLPPDGIASTIGQFYRSIEANTQPPVSGEDGSAVVRISTEILERVTHPRNDAFDLIRTAQR